MHLVTRVDEVLAQCEIFQAFEKAPHDPAAGTPTVAVFNEKLQADLPLLGDVIALRGMDVFFKYSRLIPVRTKTPRKVWGALCSSRIGVIGPPNEHPDG